MHSLSPAPLRVPQRIRQERDLRASAPGLPEACDRLTRGRATEGYAVPRRQHYHIKNDNDSR
jgi:hypothetical protein